MSASEKLRALDGDHPLIETIFRAMDFVPLGLYDEIRRPAEEAVGEIIAQRLLIADVVEAAEAFVALPDVSLAEAKAEDMWRAIDHYKQLARALTVLREHLEGGEDE